jgi:hypothetical protein
VLERHAATVVPTHDSIDSTATLRLEIDPIGTGVSRVLEQLPDKDPRIATVAARFEDGATTKDSRGTHDC